MAAKKYSREALLRSKEFSGYQKDFLGVLLRKPEYTLQEARRIVKEFYHKERDCLWLVELGPTRTKYGPACTSASGPGQTSA